MVVWMDAADHLRTWRRGRSFREAAEELEIDPSHMRYLEERERAPGREISVRIERVTGIPVSSWGEVEIKPRTPRKRSSRAPSAPARALRKAS